jgi:hypothetical protein
VKTKLISDFGSVHCILSGISRVHQTPDRNTYGKILFVGKHKKESVPELVFVEHALQFLASLDHTVAIIAVNDKDDALCVLEVVSPQRSDLVLSTDIPHGELDVLVFDGLNVEAYQGSVFRAPSVDLCTYQW